MKYRTYMYVTNPSKYGTRWRQSSRFRAERARSIFISFRSTKIRVDIGDVSNKYANMGWPIVARLLGTYGKLSFRQYVRGRVLFVRFTFGAKISLDNRADRIYYSLLNERYT